MPNAPIKMLTNQPIFDTAITLQIDALK